MKVYLISGKAGSGKNEVASLIKSYYEEKGKKAAITEVSKYIKVLAKEILNWDGNESDKPRKFLQETGYTFRHILFDQDFFINRIIEETSFYEKYLDILIISDIRLPNEIDTFKEKLDAVSINVKNEFSKSALTSDEQQHETEVALDNYQNFDYVLENAAHEDLRNKVINIVEEVDKDEK